MPKFYQFVPSIAVLSLLLLCSFNNIEWTSKSCNAASCKIAFPSDKIEEKLDIHTNKSDYIFSSRYKKQLFQLTCTVYNPGATSTFEDPSKYILEAHLSKQQAELIDFLEATEVGTTKTTSVHYKITGEKLEGMASVLVDGHKVYKLEVLAPEGKFDASLAQEFFKSFEKIDTEE